MKNLDNQMEQITGKKPTKAEKQRQELIDQRRKAKESDEQVHSLAHDLLQDLKASNKRMFVIILVVLSLWFATIGGFVLYLNQFDVESYELSTDGGGNANYIGNDGDIHNGENQSESNAQEKR